MAKKVKLTDWEEYLSKMPEEQAKAIEELFDKYYTYIYTYEIGHPNAFNDKKKADWMKFEFVQYLKDEAHCILVNDGY